jgi:N-acetyl-anhydromuramyl-L-alanine amidase AmpD
VPTPKVVLPPLVYKHSPNQSARVHGQKAVRLIVVHTPEGAYGPMVRYMTDPNQARKVSYHGLLREDGREFTQLVPWGRKAWHAGAYNSLSEGISAAGYAAKFNVRSEQSKRLARIVAYRLTKRGLKAQWTTNPAKGGFCRHADLQTDRSDPMSRAKWLIFVGMVKAEKTRGRFRRTWGKGDIPWGADV